LERQRARLFKIAGFKTAMHKPSGEKITVSVKEKMKNVI